MTNSSKLGWLGALAIAIGLNIGGGFWAIPVIAGSIAGPITTVIALATFLIVLLAAPTYILLTMTLPVSPGNYYYPTRLLTPKNPKIGQFIGFSVIWSTIFMVGFATLRTILSAGAAYLNMFIPGIPNQGFLLLLLLLTFVIAWFGLEAVGWAEIVMSAILLGSISVIIGFGLLNIEPANLTPVVPRGISPTLSTFSLMFATVVAGFSVIDIAGELEDPTKLGGILLAGAGVTTIVSALIVFVSVGTVPFAELQNQTLQTVTAQYLPSSLGVVSLIGAFIAGISTSIGLVAFVNRYIMAAAEDGVLPTKLSTKNKHGEPKYVIFGLAIVAAISAVANIPLSQIVSAGAVMVVFPVLLMCIVGIRLPSHHPELFKHDSVQESRFLSPQIVRWSAAAAAAILLAALFARALNTPQSVFWYAVLLVFGAAIYIASELINDQNAPRMTSEIDEKLGIHVPTEERSSVDKESLTHTDSTSQDD